MTSMESVESKVLPHEPIPVTVVNQLSWVGPKKRAVRTTYQTFLAVGLGAVGTKFQPFQLVPGNPMRRRVSISFNVIGTGAVQQVIGLADTNARASTQAGALFPTGTGGSPSIVMETQDAVWAYDWAGNVSLPNTATVVITTVMEYDES